MKTNSVYNQRYFPVKGYLRGVVIDATTERFSFILNRNADFLLKAAKGIIETENIPENLCSYFFETNLTPQQFVSNPEQLAFILDWDAHLIWAKNTTEIAKLEISAKVPTFVFSSHFPDSQQEINKNIYFSTIKVQKPSSVFDAIFSQTCTVSISQMLAHNDVVRLAKNGFNPFFYGKRLFTDNIENIEFKSLWRSAKTNTDICLHCEFRHVCIDNRLPTQRKTDNLWYHKTECNYNPYIAKWKGEEGYRTLAQCGVKSDENGFSIDHEKIAEINEELWGEE